ncbi:MAG: beta-hydroxylase, partial [Armatimonadota bacterium]|nr:beta-hydroxylase [Armatimonadota bacterium]
MKKWTRFLLKAGAVLVVYTGCGIYDVARNKKVDRAVVKKYFLGNGAFTWLLSPFNIFMDILALPYVNRGVYQLDDLPQSHQDEIQRLIDAAHREDLVSQLEELTKDNLRTMIFFKWYGSNVPGRIHIPAFHEKYKYIKTIGVSVFNKKESTSRHFGPLRATLRVLY